MLFIAALAQTVLWPSIIVEMTIYALLITHLARLASHSRIHVLLLCSRAGLRGRLLVVLPHFGRGNLRAGIKNGQDILLCTTGALELLRPTVLIDADLTADAFDVLRWIAQVWRTVLLGIHCCSNLNVGSQEVGVEILQGRRVRLVRIAEHVTLQAVSGCLVLLQLRGSTWLLEITCLAT